MRESEPQKHKYEGLPISDRYEIDAELGKGSYATVYKAFDVSANRFVAIKVPFAGPPNSEARQQLQREMRALYDLEHPNIVTVLDAAVNDEHCYLAMDLITGPRLKELTGNPRESAKACYDIAQGLEHLHLKGFIHRDVKPGNILVDKNGTALLSDFGCSKHIFSQNEFSEMQYVKGTPKYMSPEQAATGTKLDPRTDIYSLGIVLYQLLVGIAPDEEVPEDQIQEAIRKRGRINPRDLNPLVPVGIADICSKCLEPNRNDRYESAGHLARDLREFIHTGKVDVKLNPPAYKKWIAWSLALTAVVVILIAAAMKFSPLNKQIVQVPDGHKAEIYPEDQGVETFDKDKEKAFIHPADREAGVKPKKGHVFFDVKTNPPGCTVRMYQLDQTTWEPKPETKLELGPTPASGEIKAGFFYLVVAEKGDEWMEVVRWVPRSNDTIINSNGRVLDSERVDGVVQLYPITLHPVQKFDVESDGFYLMRTPELVNEKYNNSFFSALDRAERFGATIAPYSVLKNAHDKGLLSMPAKGYDEYCMNADGFFDARSFLAPHAKLMFSKTPVPSYHSDTKATHRLARRKKPYGK